MPSLDLDSLPLDSPEFESLSNFEGPLFASWVDSWQALRVEEKDGFTHPVWAVSWLAAFAASQRERYRLLLLRCGDEVVTGLPVRVDTRVGPLGRRLWIGHPLNGFTGGASLALPEELHREFFAKLFATEILPGRRPLAARFQKVDSSNTLLSSDVRAVRRPGDARAIIDLESGFEGLSARLSRNFKNALRKSSNHLHRLSDVSFEDHTKEADVLPAFEAFIEVESSGWKGRKGDKAQRVRGHGLAIHADLRDYYRRVVRGLARANAGAVHLLRAEGRVIGGLVSAHYGDVLLILRIARDEAYPKCSPGHLVLAHVFEHHCRQQGLTRVNCVGTPDWLMSWRPRFKPMYQVVVYPDGWRGHWGRLAALDWRAKLRIALTHPALRRGHAGTANGATADSEAACEGQPAPPA